MKNIFLFFFPLRWHDAYKQILRDMHNPSSLNEIEPILKHQNEPCKQGKTQKTFIEPCNLSSNEIE